MTVTLLITRPMYKSQTSISSSETDVEDREVSSPRLTFWRAARRIAIRKLKTIFVRTTNVTEIYG